MAAYSDYPSGHKDAVNAAFADLVKHRNHDVVILDSVKARTTQALLTAGVHASRIHIVEHNAAVQHQVPRGVSVHHADVFDYLRQQKQPIVAFLDLMCADISASQAAALQCCEQVWITLSARSRTGVSIARRVYTLRQRLRPHGLLGLSMVYGYRRRHGASVMYVLGFCRQRVTTKGRICKRHPSGLVQWWGFPQRKFWTHTDDVQT